MRQRSQLFAVKPVEVLLAEMEGENRLRRVLGPVSLTALGVGAIIGAGIFVLTGLAAHDKAGPGLILSFVVAGIGCALAALCYAEFASMVPVAGSAYTYAYATLGELFAWIIGWDLVLEYAVASSTVAHGWSHYFLSFLNIFGITLPERWTATPIDIDPATRLWMTTGSYCNLPAALVVLFITVVLVIGNSASIFSSLLAPGSTIPSTLANEVNEASGLHLSALFGLGLILFAVTLVINTGARLLIRRATKRFEVGTA